MRGQPFAGGDTDAAFRRASGRSLRGHPPIVGSLEKYTPRSFPVAGGCQHAFNVIPGILHVDQQREVRADGGTAGSDDLGDFFVLLVHAAVVVGAEQGDLELGGSEADVAGAQHPFHE